MGLSKNNRFSTQEAINYIPHRERKVPVCEMLESSGSLFSTVLPILSWSKLNIIAYRGRPTIFLHHLSWSCFVNT